MELPPLVMYSTTSEYKQHYETHYCRKEIFTFDGLRVYFRASKFGHAFYESTGKDGKKDVFSEVRSQRIDWIKATLENPNAELYQGWNKVSKVYDCTRRVSIVFENFVVVIWINKLDTNGQPLSAEFITAYEADASIDKIRRAPRWLGVN